MQIKIKEILRKYQLTVKAYINIKKFYVRFLISDKQLLKKKFKERVGRELELEEPIKFNDKLQWLKLNWYDSMAKQCADKYAVRKIIEERIGCQYLNEMYGVYESVDEIDLNILPNKFILKCTHGSGFNIICKDKSNMNWEEEFKKIKRWLKKNYYLENKEWVYKNINPRIICEKYLNQGSGDDLRDYRFFCFNNEPKFISVDFNITDKKKTRRNLYDLKWNLMDAEISYPKEKNIKVDKPEKFEEMLELSRKLSTGFPHARVDFYYIENRIIFGEITFFHQSGMGKISPEEFEITMGYWLELPKKD